MFSEILKIIPKLDRAQLNAMESQLSKRFGKIAGKFGKGLTKAVAGGGIAALGVALIDKILNPLQATQDAIDKMLKTGDDVVTNAQQFGTTPGKLLKLRAMGSAKGLEGEQLDNLITKFQTAVAEAKADPTKQTSVRQFTDIPDTAEAFFAFIQSLKAADPDTALLAQKEIFGEKQILKVASFLNADFDELSKALNMRTSAEYDSKLMRLDKVNALTQTLAASRELEKVYDQGGVINSGMARKRDQLQGIADARETAKMGKYDKMSSAQALGDRIAYTLEILLGKLSDILVSVEMLEKLGGAVANARGTRTGKKGE